MLGLYQKESVTWVRLTRDQWNKTSQTLVPTKARVERKTRQIRDFNGETVISDGSLLVSAKPGNDDRFIVDGRSRPILNVHEKRDFLARGYQVFYG